MGSKKPLLHKFGPLGFVQVHNLPPAKDCRPISKIGFTGPRGPAVFAYPNGCGHDLARAVYERVFMVKRGDGSMGAPPQPTRDLDALTAHAWRYCWKPLDATPAKLEDVPLMMNSPVKQRLYSKAVESLSMVPVRPSDAYIDSFVKIEPANHTAKVDPVPRLIQPRKVRYNVCVARYLKPYEKTFYAMVDSWPWDRPTDTPVIFKCLDPNSRGACAEMKLKAFTDGVALGSDASRFDQHISPPVLKWEHTIYKKFFAHSGEREELDRLLSWQLVNKGFARAKDGTEIRYERHGCRMSGDMNTALGNCLVMAGLMFGFSKIYGIRIDPMIDGDDCVLFMERSDVARVQELLPKHFLQAGFTLELSGVANCLEEVEFCQSRPVWNGRQYTMVRNPVKALSTDLAGNAKWAQPRHHHTLRVAVGTGGGHLCVGVPIFQAWYERLRGGEEASIENLPDGGFVRMARPIAKRRRRVPVVPITDAARVSFYRAYGILPDLQEALEEHICTTMELPTGPPCQVEMTMATWRFESDQFLSTLFL